MEKLNTLGIGPKIGRIALPWLAVTIFLSIKYSPAFSFIKDDSAVRVPGIIITAAGLVFYISTVRLLLKGLKETRLITSGPYSLCTNPLYSSIMLIILPGLSLILNSWLVLTTSVVGYVLFRVYIKSERIEMQKFFGEAYLKYEKETPEFFPFPIKKLLKKSN
jgi:protein-S-isoprenylcysteine O-methyltransferase Ste14